MTESSKRRMEAEGEKQGFEHNLWIFMAGYEAGMQDPEANKELLDECERLLKVFKEHSRECADDFSFVWSDAIHDAGNILEKLREARK